MGRSIGKPALEAAPRQKFTHSASGTELQVEAKPGTLVHKLVGGGRTSAYAIAWAIGSGNAGKSYLIRIGDALFQSPISWYSVRKAWDLSPGFEQDKQPGFYRPVTADCLFCHTGGPRPREGTLNRYLDPPFEPAAIGCERCHGDPGAHIASPTKSNIVNPARLQRTRRDAVCEQCHLSGEARIPNSGRKFTDYRPGMLLEDVFSVYVNYGSGDPKGLKVVGHTEQMVRSRCYVESAGRMWCGTCHNPHSQSTDRVTWYREKCFQCHESGKMEPHRKSAGEDCAACHMPKSNAYDGGHTAFHDHRIGIEREGYSAKPDGRLRAWREPADAATRLRNLGLAYISIGSKTGNSGQLLRGLELLDKSPADGAVNTARGLVLVQAGKTREAIDALRAAVQEQPDDSTRRLNLAAALLASGERRRAKAEAEKAIELEPLLEDAYALLAEIEPARAKHWRDTFHLRAK
jgi:predicted CXXCH cytochrome family protein